MWSIGQWMPFRSGVLREFLQVVHFKSEVRQIGANLYRAALIEFTNFYLLVAAGRLEKNELRTAPRCVATDFFQPEHVFIKGDSFLQVMHAIAGVQQSLDHPACYLSTLGLS